jgi:hypothetical protein
VCWLECVDAFSGAHIQHEAKKAGRVLNIQSANVPQLHRPLITRDEYFVEVSCGVEDVRSGKSILKFDRTGQF